MDKQNTRRGFTQQEKDVVICPPCGESVALATKEGQNKEYTLWPLLPRLTAVLPPQGREITAHGFTLIELLVVVLIIGILAAVALPQYNKAVNKSRQTEILVTLNAIQKATDVYILSGRTSFQEDFENNNLDITPGKISTSWALFGEERLGSNNQKCYHIGAVQMVSGHPDFHLWRDATGEWKKYCIPYNNTEDICHSLESQGWIYDDGMNIETTCPF